MHPSVGRESSESRAEGRKARGLPSFPEADEILPINALGSGDPLWRGVGAPTTADLNAHQIPGANSPSV